MLKNKVILVRLNEYEFNLFKTNCYKRELQHTDVIRDLIKTYNLNAEKEK
jgi:hypothetical protein